MSGESGKPRPADASLAAPMAVLHSACFDEAWDASSITRLLAMPGTFAYVADAAEGGLDGMVIARLGGGEAEILTIGVHPQARGRGLGRLLLEVAAAHAVAGGAEALFLEVAEDNLPARRLYETCGFVVVGRRPGYYRRKDGAVAAQTLKLDLPRPVTLS